MPAIINVHKEHCARTLMSAKNTVRKQEEMHPFVVKWYGDEIFQSLMHKWELFHSFSFPQDFEMAFTAYDIPVVCSQDVLTELL